MKKAAKIAIENVLQPGKTYNADAAKYEAMKKAVLKTLPSAEPGITVAELQAGVLPHLPRDLFPGGEKAGWWVKAVQLDLSKARSDEGCWKERPVEHPSSAFPFARAQGQAPSPTGGEG